MNEDAAKAWLKTELNVPRETISLLTAYRDLVLAEAKTQNLISTATEREFWARHVVDSAQLVRLTDKPAGVWLDIGSGAGLPGIVTAILTGAPTILVEPRARRADFLERVVGELGLTPCRVVCDRIERTDATPVDTITARALAPLPRILELGLRFAHSGTIWLLPKGRNATGELASLANQWQGAFTTHPSVTDPESGIIIARSVSYRDAPR